MSNLNLNWEMAPAIVGIAVILTVMLWQPVIKPVFRGIGWLVVAIINGVTNIGFTVLLWIAKQSENFMTSRFGQWLAGLRAPQWVVALSTLVSNAYRSVIQIWFVRVIVTIILDVGSFALVGYTLVWFYEAAVEVFLHHGHGGTLLAKLIGSGIFLAVVFYKQENVDGWGWGWARDIVLYAKKKIMASLKGYIKPKWDIFMTYPRVRKVVEWLLAKEAIVEYVLKPIEQNADRLKAGMAKQTAYTKVLLVLIGMLKMGRLAGLGVYLGLAAGGLFFFVIKPVFMGQSLGEGVATGWDDLQTVLNKGLHVKPKRRLNVAPVKSAAGEEAVEGAEGDAKALTFSSTRRAAEAA